MGTRNLTAVVLNGEYKIAQYGQWDGYPSGQGVTALTFLHSKARQNKLKKQLAKCVFVTDAEIDEFCKANSLSDWMTDEQAAKFHRQFPNLNRDHGAKILEMVADSDANPIQLRNSIDFANDSLFCEYAYVIDFDKNSFEVYGGFNDTKEPCTENRFQGEKNKDGYYPIVLTRVYDLDALPTKADFLTELEKDEE